MRPPIGALDVRDADLGGVAPVLFDLPGSGGATPMVPALGKDGKAYLLDGHKLGGIGGGLDARQVSPAPIRTAPAAFPTADGVFVAFQGPGSDCPAAGAGARGGLAVRKIAAGSRPRLPPPGAAR